jgi:diacylglycerol kinase family enzyme
MSRWLAIANPAAGAFRDNNFTSKWLPEVLDCVADVSYTEAPRQAAEIARSAHNYDGIVVIGGDGTIFDVLSGIAGSERLLALVPAGRGNSLALDLGIGELSVAVDALKSGEPARIDLLEVNVGFADGMQQTFLAASTLAVGYVADVVRLAPRFSALGRYAYTAAAVCSQPRNRYVESEYDSVGKRDGSISGISINNTRYLANFLALPEASISDGQFDALELRAGWARQLAHNLSVLSHTYIVAASEKFCARTVHMSFPTPQLFMADGELFENVVDLRVVTRPGALAVQRLRIKTC